MNTVVISTFDSYIDANIIMGRLQSEGIHCFLRDEYTVTIDPILSNAIGGIKLAVPENEAQQAKALLRAFDEAKKSVLECPQCHSHNVEYISNPAKSGNWLSAIIGFLFANYALSIKKVYHCFNCGFEFESMPDTPPE